MPGLIMNAMSTECCGISSRTRSKVSGASLPSRAITTLTWVPLGPFSMVATALESSPSADLPSMDIITSPGLMPALNAGVPSNGASTTTWITPSLSGCGWIDMPTP